ncbi:MAG: hypothetical protein ACO3JL_09380 [Myxococcota bacterium]
MRKMALLACLGVFSACDTVLSDDANAAVTLTLDGGGPVELVHSVGLSRVQLTPPLGREIDLSFIYNDPAFELLLRVDGTEHEEGERLPLPHPDVELSVDYDGATFAPVPEDAGVLILQIFDVDDERGAALVNLDLDVRLSDESARSLEVTGYVEGSVGQ